MSDLENFQGNESQWSYKTYRLIMWMWMMNEFSVVFAVASISHKGFYVNAILYTLGAICIGIPLVYSEICVAQYTNCNVVSMWKFFPILKGVGWASIYLVILKIIHVNVLSSWYLIYTYYAMLDPPPWFTCNDFDSACIIKSINISTFQHCIEAQILFDDDCGMKSASKCFFDREIGENTTNIENHQFLWKPLVATCLSSVIVFVFYLKREKTIRCVARFLALYISVIVFVFLWVSFTIDGVWCAKKVQIDWDTLDSLSSFNNIQQGFLSCGTGCGIIGYLTSRVSFRSPATMTSIATTLFSLFFSVILALILYSSIRAMSYYHAEELYILEIGDSIFFEPFASVAEVLSYINQMPIWSFIWFLTIYLFLLMILLTLYSFLIENLRVISKTANIYLKSICVITMSLIQLLSYSFYYSDLATALTHVIEILQLLSSVLFSISTYWIYGFKNHAVDITFMIGIKASYFWKTAWVLNPLFITAILYFTWIDPYDIENTNDKNEKSINYTVIIFYALISIYVFIIVVGIIYQFRYYFIYDDIRNVFCPEFDWGPQDDILLKSRKMFVPEIMTREFLYRQVKIHGYCKNGNSCQEFDNTNAERQMSLDQTEWNALTSN